MAENFTPVSISTFVNDTSAVVAVNNNFTAIANVLNDVLSRSGVTPNQMGSTLDMNSNQIINLPFPATPNSPARLSDITPNQTITSLILSGNNTYTGSNNFQAVTINGPLVSNYSGTSNDFQGPIALNVSTGTGYGIQINQTSSGNTANTVNLNGITVNDTVNDGSGGTAFINALGITHTYGSSAAQGARQSLSIFSQLNAPTNAGNTNRTYVGLSSTVQAASGDGGTGTGSGNSFGLFTAGQFTTQANASATNLFSMCAANFNSSALSGSSMYAKALIQLASAPSDAVAGASINAMAWLFNQGSAVKWNNAILLDNGGGLGSWPISSNGTIFLTAGGGSAALGIDFRNTSFSVASFASNSFFVSPNGTVNSGAVGGSSGVYNLIGSTSGTVSFSVPAVATFAAINAPLTLGLNGGLNGFLVLNGSSSGNVQLIPTSTGSSLTITQPTQIGSNGGANGSLTIAGSSSGSVVLSTPTTSSGLLQFASAGSFSANGAVATALTSVGPTGSHTTVQTWLTIVDNGGVTRYIPCF